MNHILKLGLDVESSPEVVEATRDVETTADAIGLINEFLQRFATPDAGPQTITITLMSTP
jgi:hypothetical protein